MTYKKDFKELIEIGLKNNQYIGLGNPNAKILFVGKEAGMPIGSEIIHGSANSWKDKKIDYSNRFMPENNIKDFRQTWQKYQKLYDKILDELEIKYEKEEYEITFIENVFTTELSNLVAPTTNEAKKLDGFKIELEKRKDLFWKSDFIKNFPIVVIMASDNSYIETYKGEVCELFHVKFDELKYAKSDKIWSHYSNNNKPKLVIHTRQLTNGASNELIDQITQLITKFIKQNSIEIMVK
ncbi:hypothetical protein [Tenacibaculum finnmarkense]|uniref:hypothetical protein n=1 Tax=Tenacibaculum finnmarkense TaxID=2781243 RepID=UPI001EFB3663|nr:hypothetical protein [Tenacibaculum finnmarkense]MCG8858543.1 hypothetical protein [Tenacibaculum finnmarkense]